jgi:hypothetical protein
MKEGKLQDLDLKAGDIVVCVMSNDTYITKGRAYLVEHLEITNDIGCLTGASYSIFKKKEEPVLRNVKLDCRNPDGTVDTEKSRAFEDAVLESGGNCDWYEKNKSIINSNISFVFVSQSGDMGFTNDESWFYGQDNKEIEFNYTRKLDYTIELVENKEKSELQGAISETQKQLDILKEKLGQFK